MIKSQLERPDWSLVPPTFRARSVNIRSGTALGQQAELALRFSELIASAIYGTVVVFHRHLTPSNGPDAPLRGTGARRQTLPCNGLPAPLAVGCSDLRSVRVDLEVGKHRSDGGFDEPGSNNTVRHP